MNQLTLICDDPTPPKRKWRKRIPGELCFAPNCLMIAVRGEYCYGHYKRKRLGQPMEPPIDPRRQNAAAARQCKVEGCERRGPTNAISGYCQPHDYRAKRGLPMDMPARRNVRVTTGVIVALAAERRGECLNPEVYLNTNTQLLWKCEFGHEWQAPWNGVKYGGSWCPDCGAQLWASRSERICRRVIELMFKAQFLPAYPAWLKGQKGKVLQLDGYNEPLRIAFEYQGDQHYDDRDHTGFFTNEKVADNMVRDALKAKICWEFGVNLIVVPTFNDLNDLEGILRQIETAVSRAGLKEAGNWKKRRPTHIDQIWVPTDNPVLQAISRFLDERKWKCLSTYIDTYTIMLWQCEKGHTFKGVWNNVKQRTKCLECTRGTKTDIPCKVLGCDRKAPGSRSDYCKGHMDRLHKGRELDKPFVVTQRNTSAICTAPNCSRPSHSHDYCTGHYHRFARGKSMEEPLRQFPKNRGKTISDARAMATRKGGRCLSTTYIKASEHLLWECAAGHQWKATYGQVAGNKGKPDGTWCGKCYHIARHTTLGQTCSVEACKRQPVAKGMCNSHYQNSRKPPRTSKNGGECAIENCQRTAKANGMCGLHYSRHLNGKPMHKRKDDLGNFQIRFQK